MFDLTTLTDKSDVTISINEDLLSQATQQEKNAFLTGLFIALSSAITQHGCDVDISNPMVITVNKKWSDRCTFACADLAGRFDVVQEVGDGK